MKKNYKIYFLLILLILCIQITGCRAQQPQAPTPAPRVNPGDMPNQWSPNPINQDPIHNNVSIIAIRNPGVSDAAAVVLEKSALVGLYLDREYTKEEIRDIKNQVYQDIKNSRDDIQNVYVTADENKVNEIRIIFEDLNKGEPIDNYKDRIQELIEEVEEEEN